MPSRHTILTEHRTEDKDQITEKTIEDEDGARATFSGPTGGPYEYDGDGEPPEWALEALHQHVDDGKIAHDQPASPDEE